MNTKTPLYNRHVELGGKMVSFGGFILPVQYRKGVIAEHMAVRNECGIFDVSHMGEIEIRGKDSLAFVNYILTNDFSKMIIGQVKYSPMCNVKGGVIDDLLVYKREEEKYLLVPNASNKDKVYNWINHNKSGEVEVIDLSDYYGQIALQGPNSEHIMRNYTKKENIPEKYYSFLENKEVLISKTGYTGENGYEIYAKKECITYIWDKLLEIGKNVGLIPCGLGARDTLRLEAGMPLYGHEMNDEITPITAGLGFAVKKNKEDFIGKKALENELLWKGKRIGIRIVGRGIARENCEVYLDDCKVGLTTSGTYLPYMKGAFAMALVAADLDVENKSMQVKVRGKKVDAQFVNLPFYKRKERK
ncbi:MAG TPA: glycine cleavage system aminomethyltransferase GcvT [Anaerovoracaceae bacterium]|nr:glycine cleavage system aminomethyltransferase GcvT [Anaerovoracaceae bacterium]